MPVYLHMQHICPFPKSESVHLQRTSEMRYILMYGDWPPLPHIKDEGISSPSQMTQCATQQHSCCTQKMRHLKPIRGSRPGPQHSSTAGQLRSCTLIEGESTLVALLISTSPSQAQQESLLSIICCSSTALLSASTAPYLSRFVLSCTRVACPNHYGVRH